MKKILSLLALLVTTVVAMAQSFTDSEVVKVGYNTTTLSDKELQIDDKGDGTYDVTFLNVQASSGGATDTYGDFKVSGLTGSTEDGITTLSIDGYSMDMPITGTDAVPTGSKLANLSLNVKFTDGKAYAALTSKMSYTWVFGTKSQDFNITFGTDENWPEIGGTIEGNPIAELTDYSPNGSKFEFPLTIDWDKQYIKAVIDVSNCVNKSENILSVGENVSSWSNLNGWHVYYSKNHESYGANVLKVDYLGTDNGHSLSTVMTGVTGEVTIEISKEKGFLVNGEACHQKYSDNTVTEEDWANKTSEFWALSSLGVGSKEGNTRSNATIKYVTVIDLPETPEATKYTNDWNVVRHGSSEMVTTENAEISVLDNGDGTYQFTIPAFSDQDGGDESTTESMVGPLTFNVNGTTADGKTTFSADKLEVELSGTGWEKYTGELSMNGTLDGDELTALFTIELGGFGDDYTYQLGFGIVPFVSETYTFKDVANVTFGEKTVDFDEAEVEMTEYEEDKYSITYKNVTLNGNNIGDLAIEGVTGTVDETGKTAALATTSTYATWTRVAENNALGVEAGDETAIRNFEGTATISEDEESEEIVGSVKFKFGFNVQGEWADVVFGEKAPEQGDGGLVDYNYQPNGAKWSKTTTIDWDKQYVKAVIDLSTCTGTNENILSVGSQISTWDSGAHYHFYYTASTKTLQFNAMCPDNKSRWDIPSIEGTVTIEISKANGLVVNGTQYLNKYNTTDTYDYDAYVTALANLWAVTDLEYGGCQGEVFSNATYKYFNVLDLPATVTDEKTYTDKLEVATSPVEGAASEVYENKTVVITTYSDGTTALTFKEFPLSETETVDLTFKGTMTTSSEDGVDYFNAEELTCTVDDANSSLNGKTILATVSGQNKADGSIVFTYEMGTEDYSVYYTGQFGTMITDAINGIAAEASAAGAQIYTIGGAKTSKLQKGINIVRTAGGKTMKVVVK